MATDTKKAYGIQLKICKALKSDHPVHIHNHFLRN